MTHRRKWLIFLALVLVLVVSGWVTRRAARESRILAGPKLEDLSYQEVTFRNTDHGLRLGGLLFVPEQSIDVPAVVIVHGSGTSRRDNPWYLALTEFLRDRGVAVLLPDKRGSASSQGNWRTATFEDLATDAAAGVIFLQDLDEISASKYGLIGMSQGGQIAPIAATRSGSVDFVVSLSGSVVPLRSQLVYEEKHNLHEIGIPPLLSDLLAYPAAWSLVHLRQRDFWSAIGNPDALPYWRKLDEPALVVYGAEDTNVPVRRSVKRLQSLDKDTIHIEVFEGSGHAVEDPPSEGNRIIRRDALDRIREFIRDVPTRTGS